MASSMPIRPLALAITIIRRISPGNRADNSWARRTGGGAGVGRRLSKSSHGCQQESPRGHQSVEGPGGRSLAANAGDYRISRPYFLPSAARWSRAGGAPGENRLNSSKNVSNPAGVMVTSSRPVRYPTFV